MLTPTALATEILLEDEDHIDLSSMVGKRPSRRV